MRVTLHTLMAYFHQRIRTRFPNPIVTLYYTQLFPLVRIWIWIPVWIVSQMVTVPILGTDLCPRGRSPSLFHTFESGDQSLNPNQWKNPAQYRNPSPNLSPAAEISHKFHAFCTVLMIQERDPCAVCLFFYYGL